jgi:hypothetical protein
LIATTNATIAVGAAATFSEKDAGCVEITGLEKDAEYRLVLVLGAIDGGKTIDDVAARMAGNSRFQNVRVGGSDRIDFVLKSPCTGTAYFVWDNFTASVNDLCANVSGLRAAPKGTVILLR